MSCSIPLETRVGAQFPGYSELVVILLVVCMNQKQAFFKILSPRELYSGSRATNIRTARSQTSLDSLFFTAWPDPLNWCAPGFSEEENWIHSPVRRIGKVCL